MISKIKKILNDACIIFTFFAFFLSGGYTLFSSLANANNSNMGFSLNTCFLLFFCAVLVRIYHNILNYEKLSMPWRVVLNYLLVAGTAFGIFMINNALFGNNSAKALPSFIFISIFTLIYSGVIIVSIIIKKRKQERENEKKEYKSITKKK